MESGRRRRRRRSSAGGEGPGAGTLILALLIAAALGISIAALVLHTQHDHLCDAQCCKDTRTHDFFDFANQRTIDHFCIDRSTVQDDSDCPFIFFPIEYGVTDGADGEYHLDGEHLIVDSRPFTFTVPDTGSGPAPAGGLDHIKFLSYASDKAGGFKAYPTRSPGNCADATELVYEGNVTCSIDLALNNISDDFDDYDVMFPDEDYRLAACSMASIALPQFNLGVGAGAWQVADFVLTNRAIFIINERLPFGKPGFSLDPINDYAAYTEVVKVARRHPNDFHKLAIVYNSGRGTIRYLIDDEEVYAVTRPGYRPGRCDTAIFHGGEDEPSFPSHVSVGFGTFTILDAYQWDDGFCFGGSGEPLVRLDNYTEAYYNPHTIGQVEPELLDDGDWVVPFPDVSHRIWGQGAYMELDYLRVYNRKCGCTA